MSHLTCWYCMLIEWVSEYKFLIYEINPCAYTFKLAIAIKMFLTAFSLRKQVLIDIGLS